MEIQPLYFQYTMPESSSGLMYVHPLQDVKQSQMWAMESQNALEQLPSAIRDYMTFDTFDEDIERKNKIIDSYGKEINDIVDSIQSNGNSMSRENRIALNNLSSKIYQDMNTGDMSLMRDNYVAYNMWLKENEEVGVTEPIVYERMKEDMKNKYLNNTSRNNLMELSTNKVIARPVVDAQSKAAIFNELYKRKSQKSSTSPITESWGEEVDYADIANGYLRNIDRGYTDQQKKYLYANYDGWTDPIIVEYDKNGKAHCVVDESHPMAEEAKQILSEMRGTKVTYNHQASINPNPRSPIVPGSQPAFIDNTTPIKSNNIEVNISKPFSYLAHWDIDEVASYTDKMKYDFMYQSMVKQAELTGNINPEDYIKMLRKIEQSQWGRDKNIMGFIDDYMLGEDRIKDAKDNDVLVDYFKNVAERISEDAYRILPNAKHGKSTTGLKNGVTTKIDSNGCITELTDDETGIRYKVVDYYEHIEGLDYRKLRVQGFYIGEDYIPIDNIEKVYDSFNENGGKSGLNGIKEAYLDYISQYKREYKALSLELADEGQNIAKKFNSNKDSLVVIDQRLGGGQTLNTQDKKFDGEIVKVKKYIGTVDGVRNVFVCDIKNDKEKDEENVLVGFTDRGNGNLIANDIKTDIIKQYVSKKGGTIPNEIYYSLVDDDFSNFYDYVNTKIVYDNTIKSYATEQLNYIDIDFGEEIKRYTGLSFPKGEFRLRIIRPGEGNVSYQLYGYNKEKDEWRLVDGLDIKGDTTVDLKTIYNYVALYCFDKMIDNGESLSYNAQDVSKNTMGKFLYQDIAYEPKDHKNMNFYDFMKSNEYCNTNRYDESKFTMFLCNALHHAYKTNQAKNLFIQGRSLSAMALFQGDGLNNTVYDMSKNQAFKKYLSFGGKQSTKNFYTGGVYNGQLTDGTIITLPEIGLEGIVYMHRTDNGFTQYVAYSDKNGVYMVPINHFLAKAGSKGECVIGEITENYYKDYYPKNRQE